MAIEISAQLSSINDRIKDLKANANDAAQKVKLVGESLKFDPKNVQLVDERLKALKSQVSANTITLNAYKDKIGQLNISLKELRDKGEDGGDAFQFLSRQLETTKGAAKRAKFQIDLLNKTIEGVEKQIKELGTKSSGLEKIADKLRGWQGIITPLVNGLNKLKNTLINTIKTSVELGAELYNLSIRYNTSTEEIQRWNKALQLATGESDLFTKSVNTMIKGISQITSGRGVAYRKALQNIGLSYSDLQGLGTEDQFNTIVRALGNLEDADLRLSAAQQLLGESGQSIAGMFDILAQEGTTLDEYLEKAERYSVITQDNAAKLKTMSTELDYMKSELQVAGAELAVAFLPLVEALVPIIKDVAKAIKDWADRFKKLPPAMQATKIFLAFLVLILPTLLSMGASLITILKGMGKEMKVVNAATSKWQIIFTAIALVIILIIELISTFSKKAEEALETTKNLQDTTEAFSDASTDYGAIVEQQATSSSTRNLTADITVRGEGDNPISDEAAVKVAQLTADELNKKLGELIK